MTFANPSPAEICRILSSIRTIAVVGLSPNPQRPGDAGITVVMNRCMWRDYSRLCTS